SGRSPEAHSDAIFTRARRPRHTDYLDGAPLEERRSRQVPLRRGLPLEARDLSQLDQQAVEEVRAEVAPAPRDAEELHDLLLSTVVHRPQTVWQPWYEDLAAAKRAMVLQLVEEGGPLWCATERRREVEALFPGSRFDPDYLLETAAGPVHDVDAVAAQVVRGHLELTGPVTASALAQRCSLAKSRVRAGLARLEAEGYAMQGRFVPGLGDEPQWCARHLLARIHGYTQGRLRRQVQAASAQDFARFLLRWQHVAPGTQMQGRAGLLAVIGQLQGFELAAGTWEERVLPARVERYQRQWLEDLCLYGQVTWGRLSLPPGEPTGQPKAGAAAPSRATPLTFVLRQDLGWLMPALRGRSVPDEPAHGAARDVLDVLRSNGATFASDLPKLTRRLPSDVEGGLWELVARGIVTSDGFAAVRSLFTRRSLSARRRLPGRRARLGLSPSSDGERPVGLDSRGSGRWALLPHLVAGEGTTTDELAELVARQLLARWGVVFWDLAAHEGWAVNWRDVLWALRRLEARGLVQGGRFVSGFAGEQYALPEAAEELRRVQRSSPDGELVQLSATDPLNLSGTLLPGKRVPAVRTRTITYRDGLIVEAGPCAASKALAPSSHALLPA
ncbi:MAG: Lhr family helicase, partial [Acidimicrobiales bacterium]